MDQVLAGRLTLYIPLTIFSLNEYERAQSEARAKRDRENAVALAEIGISPAEASLFYVLSLGLTVPPSDLCCRANYPDYSIAGTKGSDEVREALAACIAKGWLQIVDQDVLAGLQDEVRCKGLLGPIYGYPSLGGVDFTPVGAEQWFRICERLWRSDHGKSFGFCDVVHRKTSYYFASQAKAVAARQKYQRDKVVVAVRGPFPMGPWRANWWRRFPEGYRVDVEERMKWIGRGGGAGGGSVVFCERQLAVDLAQSRDVLDRHNVAFVEWLVLASLELRSDKAGIVWHVADRSKRLGLKLSDAECHRGLETCLQYGWLRQVDDQAMNEIRRLTDGDNVLMPVPLDTARSIDFSVEGAQLYRMISTEIFGPDWEDFLHVEDAYYREEHRYCASEAALESVRQEYSARDDYAQPAEIPKSIHIVAIGPWCVKWWKRFSSGFRMELTFGEP